jgi:hypothetical protein
MDARAVAEVADIEVGTLNVWVQRGLIPGMTIGARGRQRDFDLDTATHILIMAKLVRLGFGAPFAGWIISGWRRHKFLLIAKNPAKPDRGRPPEAVGQQTIRQTGLFYWKGFDSESELPEVLKGYPGEPPSVYVVVNVESLAERMRQAFELWEPNR